MIPVITACTMSPYNKLDTQGYPTAQEIADEHFGQTNVVKLPPAPRVQVRPVALSGSTEGQFTVFRNHILHITVFEHRTPDGLMAGRYAAQQTLYDRPIYALPDEHHHAP